MCAEPLKEVQRVPIGLCDEGKSIPLDPSVPVPCDKEAKKKNKLRMLFLKPVAVSSIGARSSDEDADDPEEELENDLTNYANSTSTLISASSSSSMFEVTSSSSSVPQRKTGAALRADLAIFAVPDHPLFTARYIARMTNNRFEYILPILTLPGEIVDEEKSAYYTQSWVISIGLSRTLNECRQQTDIRGGHLTQIQSMDRFWGNSFKGINYMPHAAHLSRKAADNGCEMKILHIHKVGSCRGSRSTQGRLFPPSISS